MSPSAAPDSPPPAPGPDPTLADVRLAQAGDMAAFERVYRSHAGRIMALCVRLTKNRGDAEELLQDVFVRAWDKLDAFRGESAFSSWLHRVTVNAFLAAERGDRRRRARVDTVEDPEAIGAHSPSGDPGDRIDLERAIATLPDGARMAFVMHDIEGYKHEEIAAMAGIAAPTVRAQLHRARRLLMEALNR